MEDKHYPKSDKHSEYVRFLLYIEPEARNNI